MAENREVKDPIVLLPSRPTSSKERQGLLPIVPPSLIVEELDLAMEASALARTIKYHFQERGWPIIFSCKMADILFECC